MPFSFEHDLAEEILDAIISLCSRRSLADLCLTSKKLNRIATLYLYSTISLDQRYHIHGPMKYLLPFTYLVFTSPNHASRVKSAIIPQTWNDDTEEKIEEDIYLQVERGKRPWPKFGTPDLESVLKKKCTEYAIDDNEADNIYNKIKSGTDENAIIALLLANLPNLRKLDFDCGFGVDHPDSIAMLERVANRIKPFDKIPSDLTEFSVLETSKPPKSIAFSAPIDVMVKTLDDKGPNDPEYFAAFFNLPRLRSIYGWKMGDDTSLSDLANSLFAKLKPRSCTVEYIELRTSKLHKDNLHLLMNATIPGKLKVFNYEIGCTWAWCNVEHPAIMKSLEAHHDTLESLGLSHEDFYPYQFDNTEDKPFPISFTPFKALKRIKVAPVYIWGHEGFTETSELKKSATREMLWQALPKSVEELWVTRAHQQCKTLDEETEVQFVPGCLIPALERVVQHKAETFPNLNHLRIEFPLLEWKETWLDLLACFCKTAEANGMHCTIIVCGPEVTHAGEDVERGWGWDEDIEWDQICLNQEKPKQRIVAAGEQDVGKILRTLRNKHVEKRARKM